MAKPRKVKTTFIKLLKKISKAKKEKFSGLGLLLYDSSNPSGLCSIGLRPSAECPKNLYIEKKETLDFLLEISQTSHFLHEGFHFFNEKGLLTHISQYLVVSNIRNNIIPDELHGGRYISAKIKSENRGILLTGIVCSDYSVFYFEKGKTYNPLTQWGGIYKAGRDKYHYYDINRPHESMGKVASLFRDNNVKKVLDLGVGTGRNLIYLSKKRFNVCGIDIAQEGIGRCKKKLKKEGLSAKLKIGNIFEGLPYSDNAFDAIVSVQSLQHGSLNQIKNALDELKRILRPGGLIFVTLCGRYSRNKLRYCLVKTAKKLAPKTYVPTIGEEAGLIHYIYDKKTIQNHYKNFKIMDFWRDSNDYYCFIGKNRKNQ